MRRNDEVKISEARKAIYYVGMALMGVGIITFLSVFVSGAMMAMNHSMNEGSMPIRALGGFIMIAIGGFLMNIGRLGLAGSGIKLDPGQARRDVKPWSKMAGGVVNDTLGEIEVVDRIVDKLGGDGPADEEPMQKIMVRCRQCRTLNDEDARFCDHCGADNVNPGGSGRRSWPTFSPVIWPGRCAMHTLASLSS